MARDTAITGPTPPVLTSLFRETVYQGHSHLGGPDLGSAGGWQDRGRVADGLSPIEAGRYPCGHRLWRRDVAWAFCGCSHGNCRVRFKLDENFPTRTVGLFIAEGHDAQSRSAGWFRNPEQEQPSMPPRGTLRLTFRRTAIPAVSCASCFSWFPASVPPWSLFRALPRLREPLQRGATTNGHECTRIGVSGLPTTYLTGGRAANHFAGV